MPAARALTGRPRAERPAAALKKARDDRRSTVVSAQSAAQRRAAERSRARQSRVSGLRAREIAALGRGAARIRSRARQYRVSGRRAREIAALGRGGARGSKAAHVPMCARHGRARGGLPRGDSPLLFARVGGTHCAGPLRGAGVSQGGAERVPRPITHWLCLCGGVLLRPRRAICSFLCPLRQPGRLVRSLQGVGAGGRNGRLRAGWPLWLSQVGNMATARVVACGRRHRRRGGAGLLGPAR